MATVAETVFRTLTMEEARALLARNSVGRLAYAFHDRVDIEPIHYVMDGDWIYGRTSIGTKLATLAHHPWCALEADEVRGTFDWQSVVLKGPFYLLDPQEGSPDVYAKALELVRTVVPEAFSLGDPAPQRMALFRIHMSEVTGRAASRRRVT